MLGFMYFRSLACHLGVGVGWGSCEFSHRWRQLWCEERGHWYEGGAQGGDVTMSPAPESSTVVQWEKIAGNGPCGTRTPMWSIGETQATGIWEILKRTFAQISVGALSAFNTSVHSFSECIW